MAHIVIMGAGLGGMPAAYEMRDKVDKKHKVTVVSDSENFQFVPSNPWVAVKWRERAQVEMPVRKYLERKGIEFISTGVKRVHPDQNQLELNDGKTVNYDYLVIATGPKLAFDEIEGFGPQGTYALGLPHRSCDEIACWLGSVLRQSWPDRRRRGAGRLMFRPGL